MEGNGAGAGSRFLIVSAALSGLLFFSFLGLRFTLRDLLSMATYLSFWVREWVASCFLLREESRSGASWSSSENWGTSSVMSRELPVR